jgi:PST family polysaccharide transporter
MTDATDLKKRTIRAGVAKMCTQAANFLMRLGSTMVLARLLDPKDYGLVAMVTAVTGVLSVLGDFGLSSASVQRATINREQISTLFWINLLLGGLLTIAVLSLGPALSAFYHEPRLVGITSVLAVGFLINGAGAQHSALLQRELRFTSLAFIHLSSLLVSIALAIGMAEAGYGYWALVVSSVSGPLISTLALWLVTKWVPSLPRRGTGIWSMMRFGGTMTLNGLIWTVANGFDKILLGRYWGPDATGIYYNASQLIRIPIDNLNSALGDVAFSALSRIQDDPERFKRYFLKGYTFIVALTLPITVVCAVFADDIIAILLGPKWTGAADIFRILSATILFFAILNPLGWLLNALGLVERGLKIAIVSAPLLIAGYMVGLPYGPKGVALAYSTVMTLGLFPLVIWAVHGTVIGVGDIVQTFSRPLISSVVAAAFAFGISALYGATLPALPRLIFELFAFGTTYVGVLLFVAGWKSFYLELFRGAKDV